ncbi:unnamed protein product [Soboliphyme baturini]|uniref:ANK_REP_REGION domain-containing protein n=1 Tax=Soboliphyme baturini TaxID=241478 RepID=A0A183IKI6_9BILA|nr:unnamed protein product [Soboliphyme baturini]
MVRGLVVNLVKATEKPLTLTEKQYLLASERGDVSSLKMFLTAEHDDGAFNKNCKDPLGRTSLRIAVDNENIEMIELLLENGVETGDCLLHAINEENVEAVETILNHLEQQDEFTIEV